MKPKRNMKAIESKEFWEFIDTTVASRGNSERQPEIRMGDPWWKASDEISIELLKKNESH